MPTHSNSGTIDFTPLGYARFWLGKRHLEAQHRAHAYLLVWADIVTSGETHWTEDRLAEARELAERKVTLVSRFVGSLHESAACSSGSLPKSDGWPRASSGMSSRR